MPRSAKTMTMPAAATSATGAGETAVAPFPRRRGRPRAAETALRSDLLLRAAREEFLTHGFSGANVDRIARNCGQSKMTIYRQIGTKEALFRMVMLAGVQSLDTDYQSVIDAGRSPAEVIRGIVRVSRESSNPETLAILRLVISQGLGTEGIVAECRENTYRLCQPVARYLRRIGAARDSDEAVRQALILQSMAVGGFLKMIGCEDPDPPAWEDNVVDLFLSGIQPRLGPAG